MRMRSDLSAFQRAMASAIVSGAASDLDRWAGAKVYRNTSAVASLDALAAAYPATRAMLGEAGFRDVARDFFRNHPPSTPVLAQYGEGFAQWLSKSRHSEILPCLAEVAAIDRLQLEAHLAADAGEPPLAPSNISDAEWMQVAACLHPATRFRWFDEPAPSIWNALRAPDAPSEIAPDWKAEGIVLTRPGGAVEARVVDRMEFELLAALAAGEIVGAAAIAIAQDHSRNDVGAAFGRLIGSGAIYGFERKEQKS
jgi:hypothetical protein